MHVWIAPRDVETVTGLVCTCENVRIGGCVGGFQGFTCAVTEDDCPWDQYFPPYSLKRIHGHTCNLCQGAQSTAEDELDELAQQEPPRKKRGMSTTSKALLSVFFLIGAITLTTFYVYRRRRINKYKRKSSTSTGKEGEESTSNGDEKSTDTKVSDSEIILFLRFMCLFAILDVYIHRSKCFIISRHRLKNV
jgi:hypothetical protein